MDNVKTWKCFPTSIHEVKMDMSKQLKGKNYRFLWWHSHHTMAAFWSNTDLTAIQEFNEGDFSFALVVNLKQEYKMRVSVWKPIEVHKDVEIQILNPKTKSIPKKLMEEVKDLCNKEPIVSPLVTYHNHRQTNIWGDYKVETPKRDLKWEELFNQTYEFIDSQAHDVIMGEIDYDKFSSNIDKFNKKLENKECGISIAIPSKNQSELTFNMSPEDYIQVNTERESLAQLVLDEINDMRHYNYGYGVVRNRWNGGM